MKVSIIIPGGETHLEVDQISPQLRHRELGDVSETRLVNPRPSDAVARLDGHVFEWVVVVDGDVVAKYAPGAVELEDATAPVLVVRQTL